MRRATWANDAWIDEIKLDNPDSEYVRMYGRRIPAGIILLAICSKTSPESMMKIIKQLEPIKQKLLKEEQR
jgi:hypothetical protein